MKEQHNEIKIGMMVFMAMLVATLAIFYVGDFNFFVDGYNFNVVFNHANGITLNSPVNLNGIKVGDVASIDFIYVENRSKVRLNLWVNQKAIIHTNCRVTIDTMGLMGEKVINIISRDAKSPKVKIGDELVGIDPPQIGELLMYSAGIAKELKNVIKSVNLIVGDIETKKAIANNLQNTEKLTRELAEIVSESKESIVKTMKSAQSITATMDKILAENRDDFRKTVDNFSTASVTIKEGSTEVVAILKEFGNNVNKLVLDNRDDIKTITDNLAVASENLKTSMVPAIDNLKEVSIVLNAWMSGNHKKMSEIVASLSTITGESQTNILKALENFEKVSANIKNISDNSQKSIQSTIDNVAAISSQLKDVLGKLSVITEKIEKGEGTLGGLLTDKEIFDDLKKLIQDVNAHPWKLLRKE